ncbi:3-chlorobenzoate-3,4-dioxygenase [Blastopirellula marina]|uniref:3-chlorobenzoate-3,4-dioxygenase n=1 Tax=Blastopirellula marina TaxID=124 RepID=A0A2S8G494_9BACT|nr:MULTISPECIES: Gfo/Idh/MocA family oxidoreductase [Pirellulaceae]PQO39257.1 3-chlorobenzoate-3,4-dioxygenase [Blastopirellula marina]RCS55565.1 gfo/Idh/MocA family oxidoreductase [Bremerella cremea]
MKRRTFLAASSAALLTPSLAYAIIPPRPVAVIGHTGRGNYGHGLDTMWQKIDTAKVVAVADADPRGLSLATKRLEGAKGFADYQVMLEEVKPEFVAVGPRHPDQHFDMVLAAIESGAKGVYCEKPFVRTPAEADALIAAAEKHGTKVAVAHRNRYHPALKHIDKLIESGELGKVLELRGKGKGDHRGGSEDLWVLGTHILNLFCYFGGGQPKSVSGMLLQDGKLVTAQDVKPGNEGLGPLAGNEVHARYLMNNGLVAYYESVANDGTNPDGYCFQIIGSKGVVTWHIDRDPVAHFTPGNPYNPANTPRTWIPITSQGVGQEETKSYDIQSVHNHVAAGRDLMRAVIANHAPKCDIHEAAWTVEMVCGVFESHRQNGQIIEFPLKQRDNPLTRL